MFADERWRDTYDAWKLRSPDDELDWGTEPEGEYVCEECDNTGWVIDGDVADRCPACCYQPLDIDDLDDMTGPGVERQHEW